jgi:hypothetical protein
MITITNKNIYYSDYSISTLSSLKKVDIVNPEDIINFLSENVELSESVTFKRIFDIISYNVDLFNKVFYSSLGGYQLAPYLQEIENNSTQLFDSDYLEIYWHCDKFEDELNIDPSLHGISKVDVYAMDFASLNNLKDYNVKLNTKIEILDYTNYKDKEEDKLKVFLGEKSFTVFDLYNAIFYEISYFGGPQQKKEKLNELEESMTNSNPDEFITLENMIEKFESKDKYLVKYKNLRDRVEKKRVTNKLNLPKLKNCLLEKLKIYDIIKNSELIDNKYFKQLTDIEYNMQLLYGENENILYHRFWETPKCTCPKIDNLENYPSKNPIVDENCPIHKTI